jgi:hypothetical protein
MIKMPCLFVRIFHGHNHAEITRDVTPGCEWVLAGEGRASRKWDGSACAVIGGVLHKRYDAKHGKTPPPGAIPCSEPDSATGHWPHWVKVTDADKWHLEALEMFDVLEERPRDGTYELVGPKVNGNPEGFNMHFLIQHADPDDDFPSNEEIPRDFDGLREFLRDWAVEGIVFAHPDGRFAKIRRKDFGIEWPERRP